MFSRKPHIRVVQSDTADVRPGTRSKIRPCSIAHTHKIRCAKRACTCYCCGRIRHVTIRSFVWSRIHTRSCNACHRSGWCEMTLLPDGYRVVYKAAFCICVFKWPRAPAITALLPAQADAVCIKIRGVGKWPTVVGDARLRLLQEGVVWTKRYHVEMKSTELFFLYGLVQPKIIRCRRRLTFQISLIKTHLHCIQIDLALVQSINANTYDISSGGVAYCR